MKMHTLNFCLALSLIAIPLHASAHESKSAAPSASKIDASAKAAIAVVDQFSKALKDGNVENAGKSLADDVLVLETGGAERSREEYLSGHAISDSAFLKGARVEIKHRIARSDGNLAWVGTESELHATPNGQSIALRNTETMVLRRDAGQWKIVHIHWSSQPMRQ